MFSDNGSQTQKDKYIYRERKWQNLVQIIVPETTKQSCFILGQKEAFSYFHRVSFPLEINRFQKFRHENFCKHRHKKKQNGVTIKYADLHVQQI